MRRAVFLDRDGVVNAAVVRGNKPYPPPSAAALVIPPGVPGALARLRAAGYLLVVVTNQPDVARGTVSRASVEAIHERLRRELPLDAILACYHDDDDACACRKPAPGMLREAAERYEVDLARSFMVGDRWKDIEAGRRAGCTTLLVDAPYSEAHRCQPNYLVADLAEAADRVINQVETTA